MFFTRKSATTFGDLPDWSIDECYANYVLLGRKLQPRAVSIVSTPKIKNDKLRVTGKRKI